MQTNQTPTEKTIHPMRSPALGRTKTWRRGRGGGVRGKLLGVVLTGLLVLLLWPTAAWAIDGNALPDAVFANFNQRNRVCLQSFRVTCSDVSGDFNDSRGVALGDVNGDGDLDAVFANSNQRNRVCLGNADMGSQIWGQA